MNHHKLGNGIGACLFCCILLLFIIALIPSVAATDAMFRADPQHTGVYDNGGIVSTSTALWRFKTGNEVLSSPAVANGAVYFTSYDGNLYAIDTTSGTERWRFTTKVYCRSSPAVVNGIVYDGSFDHNFYAIDAASGTEKWRFTTGDVVDSSPTVANGIVYFGSRDNNTYAIDAVTGKEKWRFASGDSVVSSPAISNGVVYSGSYDGNLYAIDAITGKEKWQFATGAGWESSSPAVANGIVYFGSADNHLYAVDAITGKEKWRFTTGGFVSSSPAVVNGVVYFGSGDYNLYAIDAITGKEKWRFATGSSISSSPAVANGVVYIGSSDNHLYAIDAITGKEKWRFAAGGWVTSSPVIANGIVYVGSSDNTLYAIDAVTGKSGETNFSLPVIVILVLTLFFGGGFGIYLMIRKPAKGNLPESDTDEIRTPTPVPFIQPTGAADSVFVEDLSNQIISVEQKASLLVHFKRPVQTLLLKARDQYRSADYTAARATLVTAENAITSLKQYETRIIQWKSEGYVTTSLENLNTENLAAIASSFQDYEQHINALQQEIRDQEKKEESREQAELQVSRIDNLLARFRKDGVVVSDPTGVIRQNIAEKKYDDAITAADMAITELHRIQELYAKAKSMRSSVHDQHIIDLFEKGEYVEFIRSGSEWLEREKKTDVLKKKASELLENTRKFGHVTDTTVAKLASDNPSDIESAINDLESFTASAKPSLIITLDQTRLVADKWHKVNVKITNNGDAHAFDVNFTFSSEFETKWINPTNVEAGKDTIVEIGILPKKEGNIPLEISLRCRYGDNKQYDATNKFWIDVVDRMSLTPEKDAAVTPSQSPVYQFTPKPLTPKQLPPDLADRYTESDFIGKGGFARVFKAKRKDGKFVAVKIPISMDAVTGKSFIAEMQNWTKLSHPNIVGLYDFNIMPMPYFEMELCDGSLAEIPKPVGTEEAAWLIFNVCEGLKYTHKRSIIHRDLKPQNILLKNGVPKISDWGLSKVISDSTSTTATSFTPYYAAPEQVNNKSKDERTDIWQLGVILYELTTGELPFRGDSVVEVAVNIATKDPRRPSEINPGAAQIEPVILKCLEKDPAKRYQSVLELQIGLGFLLRKNYAEQLTMSVSTNDFRKSAFYCGDLVMINLLTGDIATAYKYLLDLVSYSKGDMKAEAQELSEQIKMRMEMGVTEIPDELIQKAEIIIHQVSAGFRKTR